MQLNLDFVEKHKRAFVGRNFIARIVVVVLLKIELFSPQNPHACSEIVKKRANCSRRKSSSAHFLNSSCQSSRLLWGLVDFRGVCLSLRWRRGLLCILQGSCFSSLAFLMKVKFFSCYKSPLKYFDSRFFLQKTILSFQALFLFCWDIFFCLSTLPDKMFSNSRWLSKNAIIHEYCWANCIELCTMVNSNVSVCQFCQQRQNEENV